MSTSVDIVQLQTFQRQLRFVVRFVADFKGAATTGPFRALLSVRKLPTLIAQDGYSSCNSQVEVVKEGTAQEF